jgi:heat shock protein HslJ
MNKKVIAIGLILGILILAACSSGAESTSSTSSNSIEGIVWQWQSVTEQPAGETVTVPNPQDYTITFNEDGTFVGKADCNNIAGTYSQENGFTINLGPSTLAFCGEASLDQQYVALLGEVVAGGPDGAGGLALENAGGQKRMLFSNGGAAP